MNAYEERKTEQMTLLEVKETVEKKVSAKRVSIVSLKLVRESSILYKDRQVRSPEEGVRLFNEFLGDLDREYFVVMCLDTKNQPTAINICHIGSLNASIVHPREVMKTAILSNSSSILVAHNHPSGMPEPSREDIEVTKRLAEAGKIVGIELIDHLIVGDGKYVSLKERGCL